LDIFRGDLAACVIENGRGVLSRDAELLVHCLLQQLVAVVGVRDEHTCVIVGGGGGTIFN